MSKSIAITQIEQQIEALPPIEQIMMLERIARHLKHLLSAQPIAATPRAECKGIAVKLNQVYKDETSHLDSQLLNAELTSIGRDDWR